MSGGVKETGKKRDALDKWTALSLFWLEPPNAFRLQ